MKLKILVIGTIFILLTNIASASSPYGSIDVYYNDVLLPGKEVAKPTLDVGEPFRVKINLTVSQKSDVYASLSCMEKSSFEIIDGPTGRIGDYSKANILEANSTIEYEWMVKPTERWAGGSLPLDIYYEIYDHGSPEPLSKVVSQSLIPIFPTNITKAKFPLLKTIQFQKPNLLPHLHPRQLSV
ncbi:sarcinarray family MAST domain-containing protein [Methanosarcina sp. WWM596]|uniref:sarcinarray family MAST domain-containing protein n=1 Tax=Methanosarcina sp. WWM596 TaxID=1434103 RepID=UPI000615CA38|nr:hypothetical protein MSWHS_2847 [Methanosarcina sp. WWM596]